MEARWPRRRASGVAGGRLGLSADPDDDGWQGLYLIDADGSGWTELLDNPDVSDTALVWRPEPQP